MSATRMLKRSATAADIADTPGKAPKQTRLSFTGVKVFEDDDAKSESKAKKAGKSRASPSQKLYEDTLLAIDKQFNKLYRQYEQNPCPGFGVTSDDFADAMKAFLPKIDSIRQEAPKHAFNALMHLGENSYGDLTVCIKSSGWGDTEWDFEIVDKLAIELINETLKSLEKKVQDSAAAKDDVDSEKAFLLKPSTDDVGNEWQEMREMVGKKHPNKQEFGWLKKARLADLKTLMEKRKERRESTNDWVGNALNDLVETRDRIDAYGIGDHYSEKAIALLASVKGVEVPPLTLEESAKKVQHSTHY